MVFQNPNDQLFAATVEEDVAFGPANLGLSSRIAARTQEALEAVEALDFRDRPIHDLSFGQQKRVCLAGVLAMRPPILLLDEPTAGLDPAGESQMAELLLRLRRRQAATIVVCTHAVDLLPVLADRAYVLRHGRVWREGAAEQGARRSAGDGRGRTAAAAGGPVVPRPGLPARHRGAAAAVDVGRLRGVRSWKSAVPDPATGREDGQYGQGGPPP